jgi:hypothetical protein
MYIRYCYGGLAGDLIMLQRFIQCGLEHPLYYCTIHNHDSYTESSAEDIYLLSAVDFHVFPKLLEDCRKWLAKKQVKTDLDTIKQTIWNCRSRTNFREVYDIFPPNWWDELLEYLDKESKMYWEIYLNIEKPIESKPKKKPNNTMLNYFKKTKSI